MKNSPKTQAIADEPRKIPELRIVDDLYPLAGRGGEENLNYVISAFTK